MPLLPACDMTRASILHFFHFNVISSDQQRIVLFLPCYMEILRCITLVKLTNPIFTKQDSLENKGRLRLFFYKTG